MWEKDLSEKKKESKDRGVPLTKGEGDRQTLVGSGSSGKIKKKKEHSEETVVKH